MTPNGNRMRVIRLIQQGCSPLEAGLLLGLGEGTVNSYVAWARAEGHLPPKVGARAEAGGVLRRLSPEVRRWLAGMLTETPGSRIDDHIAAIVTDAYHDEHPQTKRIRRIS
jgi:hypothetical protein